MVVDKDRRKPKTQDGGHRVVNAETVGGDMISPGETYALPLPKDAVNVVNSTTLRQNAVVYSGPASVCPVRGTNYPEIFQTYTLAPRGWMTHN